MGRTLYIPEEYLMFFAAGHQAQRKVTLAGFKRLKAIVSTAIRENFYGRTVFTSEMMNQYFYIENEEIIPYSNDEYERLFYQYRDEIIKSIAATFEVGYFHAAGVLNEAKEKWKN